MATFTTQPFHELLDSDKTTPSTVLDSDGKLKQSLHNMFPSTDATDTDYWTQTNITVTESGTSPSGKAAYLLTEGTNVGANFRLHDSITVSGDRYYALSIDVKRGSGSRNISLLLGSGAFGSAVRHTLNLDTGEITASVTGTKDAAIATELSDGWWNFTVYAEATSNFTPAFNYYIANGTNISYTGDGSSSIYLSRPRVYEASVHVPVERFVNTDFATDTDWLKTNWTIGSGVASKTVGSFGGISQAVNLVAGEKYRMEVTVSNYVAGTLTASLASGSGLGANVVSSEGITANGTYVFILTALSSSTYAGFAGSADFDGDIDDVSLTKVIDDGIQNDLDGEDFIETSGSAVYHGGLEYNVDGSFRGIQSFESRTNYNKNSGGFLTAGSSPATLGTLGGGGGSLPDNWFTQNFPLSDIEVVGIGEDPTLNLEYIDLRFNGTPTGTVSIFPAGAADGATADAGQVWTTSVYLAVVGGDTTNITNFTLGNHRYQSDTTFHSNRQINITAPTSDIARFDVTDDSLDDSDGSGDIGLIHAALKMNQSGAIDITIRIAGFQLEQGSSVSPYIPTVGSTRSRGGDKLHKPLSEFGHNRDEFSVFVEFETAGSDGSDYPRAWQMSHPTYTNNSERQGVYVLNDNNLASVNRHLDVNTSFNSLGTVTLNAPVRVMSRFKKDDFAASDDGDTVVTDTVGELASGLDQLNIGNQRASDSLLNGYVKKLIIWPKGLSNATLEAESE
mgnify:CR=1 FL=1